MRLALLAAALAAVPGAAAEIAYGDFSRFADLRWIDTHVHLHSHERIDDYVAYQDRFGMSAMALLAPPKVRSLRTGDRPNENAEALLAKALHPGRFYVFGGLDLTPLATGGKAAFTADLARQVDELADAGADGLKLYFRSTVVEALKRPPLGFDFLPDNPELAPLFERAAARGLPLLVHIDPPYTRNGRKALGLYPGVTWLVTHIGFAGSRVKRAEAILAAGKNVYLDIGHFVHSGELALAGPAARDFLIARRDRIFQSTDLGAGCKEWRLDDDACPSEKMAVSQAWNLRVLLETTQKIAFKSVFSGRTVTATGLGLPRETLEALYRNTALSVLGPPKKLRCAPALAHVDRLIAHTRSDADLARLRDIRARLARACPPSTR